MAAAVTNPLKLTWGTFVCGETTEKLIPGIHRFHREHSLFELTFDVLIRGTSDATFAANCAEMESEFSKRRQLLKMEWGSSTERTLNPTAAVNTGLNTYARIDKAGTPGADTDRSRLYTVTVGGELPSTDTSGRRDSSLTVTYDPAQGRTVTIKGVWTALTTVEGTAQYAAQIAAFCSSALGALLPLGTFELTAQETERDDQDKVVRFSRTFREMFVAQPGGSLDNASIVAPVLSITRSIEAPGDSGGGGVKRMETITCHFECWLDKTLSTDLATLWTGTIRPYLTEQVRSRFSPTYLAILNERPNYIPYTNQFTADVVYWAAIDPTDVIESLITSKISEEGGMVFTGIWNGNLFAKYADQGFATRRRFGIRAVRVLGVLKPKQRIGGSGGTVFGVAFVNPDGSAALGTLQPGGAVPAGGLGDGGGGQASGWILIANDSAATVRTFGQSGGDQITVTDLVEQTIEEWVESPGSGGPNAGVSFSGGSN